VALATDTSANDSGSNSGSDRLANSFIPDSDKLEETEEDAMEIDSDEDTSGESIHRIRATSKSKVTITVHYW
jgi:hypothetical protein